MKKAKSFKQCKAASKKPPHMAPKPLASPPEPRISFTGDIRTDLSSALSGAFEHAGQFYYSLEGDSFTPDPSLSVEGVGPVGRPLSEHGAKALLSKASMSSENVWEIQSANIVIKNPQWLEYVDEVASETLWRELGLQRWSSKPRYELKKLLIFGKGAHLPSFSRQDVPNESGVFATVMFILPSAFTGGEIHLSHGGHTAILDLKLSKGSTSFLAWYSNVVCAVKPITSGCRLSLSYDLIHTSNDTPQPSLPETRAALTPVRTVLSRWKAGQYKINPSLPLFGYFLRHTCDTFMYQCEKMGALINSDGHKAVQLLSIAQELGFSLWLADMKVKRPKSGYLLSLDHFERGDGEEAASERYQGYVDDLMKAVPTITGCVPMTQGIKHNLGYIDFKIPEDALVPVGALEDRRVHIRESGSLLLLFRNEDEVAVVLQMMGGAWTLQNLDLAAHPPTDHAKAVTGTTLEELKYDRLPNTLGAGDKANVVIVLLDCAISWRDLELWRNSLLYCKSSQLGEAVAKGIATFSLAAIQSSVQELVKGTSALQKQVQLINDLSIHLYDPSNSGWAMGLMKDVLLSYNPVVNDVPTLVSVAQIHSLDIVTNIILPNVLRQYQPSPFLFALTRELHKHRETFPTVSVTQTVSGPVTIPSVILAIHHVLGVAIQHWGKVVPKGSPVSKANSVVDMVDLCLAVGDPGLCSNLLGYVFHVRGDLTMTDMFKEVYIPLIPLLKKTAEKYGHRLPSELFRLFVFHIISWYFAEVLVPRDVVKEGITWKERQSAATAFLNSIGGRKEVSEIMGQRFGDVMKALVGTHPFLLSVVNTQTTAQAPATTSSAATTAPGVKRKHEGE